MSIADHHLMREDRAQLWARISRHIEAQPEDLRIALDNLDRWEALGRVHTGPIKEWRRRIESALDDPQEFQEFLAFLAAPNHDSEPIKSCSPFVGLPMTHKPSLPA